MFEYTIGIMREAGRPRRYLRMKSDAPITVTDPVVSFTKKQEDKTAVYECIVGDMIREAEDERGYFYRWYYLESVLIETDHTPPVSEELTEAKETIAELEDALCDAEINSAEWREGVEDALCELEMQKEESNNV